MTRRRFLISSLAAGPVLVSGANGEPAATRKLGAGDVLRELQEGNRRFASGHPKHPHGSLKWLRKMSHAQHPHAAVLCCSDSRVSPEIVFDQGIGDLFVVRVAGNVANEDEIASLEYAVEHFSTPLVVVLGHTECGAVTAVVEHEPMPREIEHLVAQIADAAARVRSNSPALSGPRLLAATVEMNVRKSMEDMVRDGEILARRVRSSALRIAGGVYQLASGRIVWL